MYIITTNGGDIMNGTCIAETELKQRIDGKLFRVTLRVTNTANTDEEFVDRHPNGEYMEWDFKNHTEALDFQKDLKAKWGLE